MSTPRESLGERLSSDMGYPALSTLSLLLLAPHMASKSVDEAILPVQRFYQGMAFSGVVPPMSANPTPAELLLACQMRDKFLQLLVGPDPLFTGTSTGLGERQWRTVMVAAE